MMKTAGLLLVFFINSDVLAQSVWIAPQVRPRLELRHGYKQPLSQNLDPAAFVSQRTRLNLGYRDKAERLDVFIAFQNVRVWGDVSTLALSDKNGTGLHEAWANIIFNPEWAFKLGRQEIIYDDHRIFGSVDWAQQGRSHDAALARYKTKKHKIDIGLALNSEGESLSRNINSPSGYNNFQFVHYNNKDVGNASLSLLALNVGIPQVDGQNNNELYYYQTLGGIVTHTGGPLKKQLSAYVQTGKSGQQDLSAFYLGGELGVAISKETSAKLGFEYLSGTDWDEQDARHSFNPIFGTNHKFNGYMDYFYVGNHANSVGLQDFYAGITHRLGKTTLSVIPHVFMAAAVINPIVGSDNLDAKPDSYLGFETDLVLKYVLAEGVTLGAGLSYLEASESMRILKQTDSDRSNYWGWMMVTVSPKAVSF